MDSSATTRSLPVGKPPIANLPATCSSGGEYFDAASQNKYSYTATNTWTQQFTAALVGTPNPVVFDHSGNFTEDSTNFVWDSTNHRLGLGNPSPADTLDLLGGKIRLNSPATERVLQTQVMPCLFTQEFAVEEKLRPGARDLADFDNSGARTQI